MQVDVMALHDFSSGRQTSYIDRTESQDVFVSVVVSSPTMDRTVCMYWPWQKLVS